MSHFYGLALSVFTSGSEDGLQEVTQAEHLKALRFTPSFRRHVEETVDAEDPLHSRSLLQDDDFLLRQIVGARSQRQKWATQQLRSLHLIHTSGIKTPSFTDMYIEALSEGISATSENCHLTNFIRRLSPDEIIALSSRWIKALKEGNPDMNLKPWDTEARDFVAILREVENEVTTLKKSAEKKGSSLRSQYNAQSRVLRTTVIAQKVQLSRDTAALSMEDKAFTAMVDRLVQQAAQAIECSGVDQLFLHEIFVYDSQKPYRNIFNPRQGAVVARGLSRPQDYLGCSCCGSADDNSATMAPTLPATTILYRLYSEAGALINVADLWAAFHAIVGDENETAGKGVDERTALALFYRALAELRAMGFVKASRKKADHVAKVKWLF